MSFNNEVRSGGKVVGYRCSQCGHVFDRMWGTTCNGCAEANRKHQELLDAIKSLKTPGAA